MDTSLVSLTLLPTMASLPRLGYSNRSSGPSRASPLVSSASLQPLSMLVIHGDLRNPNHGSEI